MLDWVLCAVYMFSVSAWLHSVMKVCRFVCLYVTVPCWTGRQSRYTQPVTQCCLGQADPQWSCTERAGTNNGRLDKLYTQSYSDKNTSWQMFELELSVQSLSFWYVTCSYASISNSVGFNKTVWVPLQCFDGSWTSWIHEIRAGQYRNTAIGIK